ncbi:hypothetical protein SK128_003712 [Halocaridina rubra]|uniref:Cytochrome P450 n=1 Tax=Halocaridina rubra TaxID=373956 RepID=A0AAN9A382_HALRR
MLIGDPDLLKSILIRDFDYFADRRHVKAEGPENQLFTDMLTNASGERWHRIRTAVTPAFTSSRLKSMFPLIAEKAKLLQKIAHDLAKSSETVEMKVRIIA